MIQDYLDQNVGLLPHSDDSKPIQPLDVYLMRMFLHAFDEKVSLLDYAAELTVGTSSVFAATHPNVRQVIFAKDHLARGWLERLAHTAPLAQSGDAVDGNWRVVMAAVPADQPTQLYKIVEESAPHLLLLTPVGRVGRNARLETLMAFVKQRADYDFCLARELHPVLGNSDVALLWSATAKLPVVQSMQRIEQQFSSNYDYVTLLNQVIADQIAASPKATDGQNKLFRYHTQDGPYMDTLLDGGIIQSIYHRLVPLNVRIQLRAKRQRLLKR